MCTPNTALVSMLRLEVLHGGASTLCMGLVESMVVLEDSTCPVRCLRFYNILVSQYIDCLLVSFSAVHRGCRHMHMPFEMHTQVKMSLTVCR